MSGIRIPKEAWVVVADGRKALFLRNAGSAQHPELVTEDVLEHENPPTHEQGTDKPGRYRDPGPGGQKSAYAETDWHQQEEDRFARQIAEMLYRAAHAGRYRELVIVAPPATLGVLREAVHREVSDRIVAEVPKTLTGHPVDRIQELLTAA